MAQTILVVDDEIKLRDMLRVYLEQEGYRVVEAGNGREALYVARYEKPDLIILDIMMPGISGLDILHHMYHDPSLTNIPVVVVSAKGTPADIKRGLEAGAKIYLTKPVGFQELKEAVTRIISANSSAASPSSSIMSTVLFDM